MTVLYSPTFVSILMNRCTQLLLVVCLLLSVTYSYGQPRYLETIKISDDIYVFKPKIDWTHSNCTAIIGTDGIFIIDTFLQTNYADEAITLLRGISNLPVTYIFNTHGHADHVIGNSIFKTAYPNCKIIMNDSTYAKYPKNYAYGNDASSFGKDLTTLEKELAEGKLSSGYILTPSMKEFWRWQIEEAKANIKFYKPAPPANGDITFSEQMIIRFGDREIHLLGAAGEGHDVGDAMAWLPKERIIITGDIVVGPTPYAIRGRVDQMIASLQQIIEMNPLLVIPGHGEIMPGLEYVNKERELFISVKGQALEAIEKGTPYAEAVNQISIKHELGEYFTQGDDVRVWAMRSFFTNWTISGTYKKYSPKK
jgi:cyclase